MAPICHVCCFCITYLKALPTLNYFQFSLKKRTYQSITDENVDRVVELADMFDLKVCEPFSATRVAHWGSSIALASLFRPF